MGRAGRDQSSLKIDSEIMMKIDFSFLTVSFFSSSKTDLALKGLGNFCFCFICSVLFFQLVGEPLAC